MHYTINKSQYQDVTLLPMPHEWTKLKRRVKECGELRQVMMESSNDATWNSPDTKQCKAAEMASKTKTTNIEAAKIKTLPKTTIKRKTAQKKVVKRKQ